MFCPEDGTRLEPVLDSYAVTIYETCPECETEWACDIDFHTVGRDDDLPQCPHHGRSGCDCDGDGQVRRIATGPATRDGGFTLTVFIRDRGTVRRALEIYGAADRERLTLRAEIVGDDRQRRIHLTTTR